MRKFVFLVLAMVITAGTALSQEARGRILGCITDSSGAAIPQVSMQITNAALGTAITIETNDAGNYQAPFLIPGTYRITAEKSGFKRLVRDGIEVRVDDRLEINLTLEVGEVVETVSVVAESPMLETSNASLGLVIDSRRVAELPLAHGVPFHLMRLAPGVTFTGGHARFDQPYAPTPLNWYAMDGARAGRSDLSMDGVPISASAGGQSIWASYVPPADAVAEFKVQTAAFDASIGQTEGGLTNISLKSGTNAPHGTLYYNKKDPSFDANNFFANRAGQPRADFTYNRWGVSANGPVFLPNVYDGRNRTFYMYGYEGIQTIENRGTTLTVPTAKERQGDFSELLNLNSSYQIYDPSTRRAIADGRFQSDPLPGNIIPASRISPIATKILSYYPLPTLRGTLDGRDNLPLVTEKEDLAYYTHIGRVDHNISDRHRIFIRGNVYKRTSNYNNWFKNLATGEWFKFLSRSAAVDDVYTFGPTCFINLRYGYNRFINWISTNPEAQGFDLTTLGFPSSWNNAIAPQIRRFPYVQPEGYYGTAAYESPKAMITQSFVASLEKSYGSHRVKTGAEYRIYQTNMYYSPNSATGSLGFDSTYTRGPFDNSAAAPIGQGLASMLLGIVSYGGVDRLASSASASTVWSLYVQDDWKLTPKFNLSLGMRYELEGPLTERFDRSLRGFDYSFAQPLEAQVNANYANNPTPEVPAQQFLLRGGPTFAGVAGQPRTLWGRDKNNFMPRVGFAYNPFRKTVVRGGYGIFYGFLGVRRADVNQAGFSVTTPVVASVDGGLTFKSTLANPFPDGIQEPRGSADGPLTFLGRGISFFNPKPIAPYMQRWQFGVQQELPHRLLIDLSYVGNRGTKIETYRDLKALPNAYLSSLTVRDQEKINYLSTNLANPFYPLLPGTNLSGSLVSRHYLIQPYPQFTSLSTSTNEGYSWYHSLQASVEKRFSHGYTLQLAYTWAKFMDASAFMNAADPGPAEVISDEDVPHRFVVSGIYELPIGRGRQLLSAAPRAVDLIVGGWQLSAVFTGQSGRPLYFGNIFFNGDIRDIPLPVSERKPEHWFNVNAGFERTPSKQPGYNLRAFPVRLSNVRGDGLNSWDVAVIKNAAIKEGVKLQFRGEFLNAFNHAVFSNPSTSVTSSAFGTITQTNAANRRIQVGVKLVY